MNEKVWSYRIKLFILLLYSHQYNLQLSKIGIYILSQSYNATVFYFDNISFLEHALNQLFIPNKSPVSQISYRTMVLTICFQLFKKQTILWRYGDWKQNEMNGRVPVSDMRHAFCAA